MPLYEYLCRPCARRFEALVFGEERPRCPKCGGTSLEKQVSTFAVGGPAGGGSFESAASSDDSGGCGSCGDPRGPGACSMN